MTDPTHAADGPIDTLSAVADHVTGLSAKTGATLLVALIDTLFEQPLSLSDFRRLIAKFSELSLSQQLRDELLSLLRGRASRAMASGDIGSAQDMVAIMLAVGKVEISARQLRSLSRLLGPGEAKISEGLLISIEYLFDSGERFDALDVAATQCLIRVLDLSPLAELTCSEWTACRALCAAGDRQVIAGAERVRRGLRQNLLARAVQAGERGEIDVAEELLLAAATITRDDPGVARQLSQVMMERADIYLRDSERSAYQAQIDKLISLNVWQRAQYPRLMRQLIKLGEFDRARNLFERAVRRSASDKGFTTRDVLGELPGLLSPLRDRGQFDHIRNLIEIGRGNLENHPLLDYHEGLLRLTEGDFDNGWRLLRSRVELAPLPGAIQGLQPWNGKDHVRGLVVWWPAGAGIGGEVMRLIFIECLLPFTDKLAVICDERLHPAMARTFASIDLLPHAALEAEALPAYTHAVDLISLPAMFQSGPSIKLLTPDPDQVADWRGSSANDDRPRCGLSWFTTNPKSRARRSLPTESVATLCEKFGDVAFFSLQHGMAQQEKPREGGPSNLAFPLAPESDVDGLLALIATMDLVVTIDNSVAHFSGGMNIPTVLILPMLADPQWSNEGAASPLYPSVHILRQRQAGVWADVIAEVECVLGASLAVEKFKKQKPSFGAISS